MHLENGKRAPAMRQYEICRSTLAKELSISSMEDTQRLYTQICKGTDRNDSAMISSEQIGFDQAIRQLTEVI